MPSTPRRSLALRLVPAALLAVFSLSACSSWGGKSETIWDTDKRDMYKFGSVLGTDGGAGLLSANRRKDGDNPGGGIGVNSFLWRASLDTIAFMPIASADPFGGVILTDWYSSPDAPAERFKVNLYILDRQLRSDALKIAVFRQQRAGNDWRDSAVGSDTAVQLEDAILTRARQLRVSQSAASSR
jgi:hypothetical protein